MSDCKGRKTNTRGGTSPPRGATVPPRGIPLPLRGGLKRADLDGIAANGCPYCGVRTVDERRIITINPRCHPDEGMSATYCDGTLLLRCRMCCIVVSEIKVNP